MLRSQLATSYMRKLIDVSRVSSSFLVKINISRVPYGKIGKEHECVYDV